MVSNTTVTGKYSPKKPITAHVVFDYGLFKDAVSLSDYTLSCERISEKIKLNIPYFMYYLS
jgi:hypothetical protein